MVANPAMQSDAAISTNPLKEHVAKWQQILSTSLKIRCGNGLNMYIPQHPEGGLGLSDSLDGGSI